MVLKNWKRDQDLRGISARKSKLRALVRRYRVKPGEAVLFTNARRSRARLLWRDEDDTAGVTHYEADETHRIMNDLFTRAVRYALQTSPAKLRRAA